MSYFFNQNKNLNPQMGDLLISEPFLPDPNFERTVILLCEHTDDGSFGFILNKTSILKFNEVMEEVKDFNEVLYVGGPVQQDTLHFIHRGGELLEGGTEIINDLVWGGNFEQLMIMIETKQINADDFKFFLGYSGWSTGQLEDELKENSWIIHRGVTSQQIFELDPNKLWKEVLHNMGGKYKMFSNYPVDPRLN